MVRLHKKTVLRFTLRIQQLSATVAKLLTELEGREPPDQLPTFADLLGESKAAIQVCRGGPFDVAADEWCRLSLSHTSD
jgi:hypothetical protein